MYEVRAEGSGRETSITYLDPSGDEALEEWANDTEFSAATFNWNGHLVSAFADGQFWFDGVEPDAVPTALATVALTLWAGGPVPYAVF